MCFDFRHNTKRQTVNSHCIRKYKDDIKTILQAVMFGIIYLSISTINNPIVSILFLGLWIGYLLYSLYSKFLYRKGKVNYILFPTVNDQYSKITSVILGLIICALSIAGVIWTESFKLYGGAGVLVGVLMFCNGIFDLPKGMLEIKGNYMNIAGANEKIDIRQIKEVSIYKDRIVVTNIYNENQRFGNLEIDEISAKNSIDYIMRNSKENDLKILNNV